MDSRLTALLEPIYQFLPCRTPDSWLAQATRPEHLPTLLIDHANCEIKAAMTAHSLIRRYCLPKEQRHLLPNLAFYRQLDELPDKAMVLGKQSLTADQQRVFDALEKSDLLVKMVRLIQEELHHFEQVLQLLEQRNIAYSARSASRYASTLMQAVRTHEPAALVDKLIIGAFIEARSCERFAALAPYLDQQLQSFYISLLRSEARHYQDYLSLAQAAAEQDITPRIRQFAAIEQALINSADRQFRFHSGAPLSESSQHL